MEFTLHAASIAFVSRGAKLLLLLLLDGAELEIWGGEAYSKDQLASLLDQAVTHAYSLVYLSNLPCFCTILQ